MVLQSAVNHRVHKQMRQINTHTTLTSYHKYIHTHVHTCIHAYLHSLIHTRTDTHLNGQKRYIYMCVYVGPKYRYSFVAMSEYSRTHTHARTHARTHTHSLPLFLYNASIYIHIHIDTLIYIHLQQTCMRQYIYIHTLNV